LTPLCHFPILTTAWETIPAAVPVLMTVRYGVRAGTG